MKIKTMPSNRRELKWLFSIKKYKNAPSKMHIMPSVVLLLMAWLRVYTSGNRIAPIADKSVSTAPSKMSTATSTLAIVTTFDNNPFL